MYAKCEHCTARAAKAIEYEDALGVMVTETVCDDHAEEQREVRDRFISKDIHDVEIHF